LNDRQYNTLKIYINTLKLNGNIANGYQNQSKYSLSDTFKQSSEYRNFVSGRERYMSHKITSFMAKEYINKLDYADATEIKLKEGQDSIHPHEMLSIMPQLKAEEYGIDVETLFNVPVETSKLAHNDAFVAISENRLDDIISAAGDMTAKEIKSELPVGNAWAQGMIDELDIMFREYETGGDFGLAKVLSQTWDYNDDFVAFAHRWYNGFDTPNGRMSGFKDLSPVAQKYATYAFLHGLNRKSYAANERHNTRNVRMVPPVSRDTITLLDPDIMERYFEEYNGALRGRLSDLTNTKDQDFVSVPRMSRIVEEYFGCG
jgi:hypothetical protein